MSRCGGVPPDDARFFNKPHLRGQLCRSRGCGRSNPNSPDAATFDDLMEQLNIIVEPLTAHQATIAREAYGRFGKGIGHPARLNFGDCFAYALAKALDEP